MPFTFNGFGTRYVGRKNLTSRHGICDHCGKPATLSSYDTRLCVCALYIPVAPLGRKRIFDDCSRCRRHRAMPLAAYQRAVDETLTETAAAARSSPTDDEKALDHLAALVRFERRDEAVTLATELPGHFPDDARILTAAGEVLAESGRLEEADPLIERALRADAAFAPARRYRAERLLAQDRVDEARALLDGGAGTAPIHDPSLLFAVAQGYQARSEHATALDRFRALLEIQPGLGQSKPVRRAVAISEKAIQAPTSILPRRTWPWRRAAAAAAVIVLGIAVAVGYNLYVKGHQVLHVVNAFPGPVTVTLDAGPRVDFAAAGRKTVTVGEGHHRAEVSGGRSRTVEFDLERGFWQRFAGNPTWTLDAGGLAVLAWEETIYGDAPRGYQAPIRVYAGRDLIALADVDYPFEDFPETIQAEEKSSAASRTRSRVEFVPGDPNVLFDWLVTHGSPKQSLSYVEHWLEVTPEELLALRYAGLATRTGQARRAAAFLKPRLTLAPVNVEWHRAYQQAMQSEDDDAARLIAEYDDLLAAAPDDAPLLYLRGRIEPDPARALKLYARAIELDPDFEYPRRGAAYHWMSTGDFARAAEIVRPAARAADASRPITDMLHEALFAAGRFDELRRDLEPEMDRPADEVDWQRARELVLLLVHDNQEASAAAWLDDLGKAKPSDEFEHPSSLVAYLRGALLYAGGHFDQLAKYSKRPELMPYLQTSAAFWVAVEKGDLVATNEAFQRLDPLAREGEGELIVSLLYARAGVAGLSRQWEGRGLDHLAPAEPSVRRFRDVLEGRLAPTRENLDSLTLEPTTKAALLTLLAIRLPEHRRRLLAAADRLNFKPEFPYHFLRGFVDAELPPAAAGTS